MRAAVRTMARIYRGFSLTEIRQLYPSEILFYLEPPPEPGEGQDA